MVPVGIQIRKLRIKKKMTQTDLALKSKVKQETICRVENAHRPYHTVRTLARIAKALDVELVIEFK